MYSMDRTHLSTVQKALGVENGDAIFLPASYQPSNFLSISEQVNDQDTQMTYETVAFVLADSTTHLSRIAFWK